MFGPIDFVRLPFEHVPHVPVLLKVVHYFGISCLPSAIRGVQHGIPNQLWYLLFLSLRNYGHINNRCRTVSVNRSGCKDPTISCVSFLMPNDQAHLTGAGAAARAPRPRYEAQRNNSQVERFVMVINNELSITLLKSSTDITKK